MLEALKRMYDKGFLYSDESKFSLESIDGQNENVIDEEVSYDDIDMSSFKIKDTLNKDIWSANGIRPRIRWRLLQIAEDFWDSVEIKFTEPIDVIITGSIANYNWSSFSDIDLHLVVDFTKIDERKDFIKSFMDAKKNIWNDMHDELTLAGFNVELYVQDLSDTIDATGIYSLYKNKWLRKPSRSVFLTKDVDDDDVRKMAANLINSIDELEDQYLSEMDVDDLQNISVRVNELYDKIRDIRKKYLDKDGEFSLGDKVYKVLRRSGYLEKLIDLKAKTYDKMMSL